MKNIVVIPNPTRDIGLTVTKNLIDKLISLGTEVYLGESYSGYVTGRVNFYSDIPESAELIIVVGGDGSVLDASVTAIERDIMMLGVNVGKIGYLSEIEPDNLDVLEKIVEGEYTVEEQMLLSVSHISGESIVTSPRYAVNDIIISHDTFLGIADFVLENSGGDSVKYRADGIILSTPAGSTAYSLSAGGPIISHGIDSIVATPICPHSFFNRSIIFRATESIKIKNTSATALNLSVDGRFFVNLKSGDECVIKQADKKLKMLTFSKNSMFATLFRKMRIMEDVK